MADQNIRKHAGTRDVPSTHQSTGKLENNTLENTPTKTPPDRKKNFTQTLKSGRIYEI